MKSGNPSQHPAKLKINRQSNRIGTRVFLYTNIRTHAFYKKARKIINKFKNMPLSEAAAATIAAVPETYRYVAGYVTKKMYEIDGKKANEYYELGQTKPFACMSLKPGLGDEWFQKNQKNQERLWQLGYIQLANGKRAAIPEYYWRKLETENPEKAWRIKFIS